MDARIVKLKQSIRALKPTTSKEPPDDKSSAYWTKRISLSKLPAAPLLVEFRLENGMTVKHIQPGGDWDHDIGGETGYVEDVDRDEIPRDKSIPRLHLGLPVVALPRFTLQPDSSTPDEGDSDTASAFTAGSPTTTYIDPPSPACPTIWREWDALRQHAPPPPSIFSQSSGEGTTTTITTSSSSFGGSSTLFSRSNSITSATNMRSAGPLPSSSGPLEPQISNPVVKKPLETRTTDYHGFVYAPTGVNGNQLPTINDIIGDEVEDEEEEEEEEAEYHLPIIKAPRRNWVNFSFRNNSEFLPVE